MTLRPSWAIVLGAMARGASRSGCTAFVMLASLSASVGCAATPLGAGAVPAAQTADPDHDPYEGWLFRKLSGRQQAAAAAAPATAAGAGGAAQIPNSAPASGVVQASATQYLPPPPNPATAPLSNSLSNDNRARIYPPPAPIAASGVAAKPKEPAFDIDDISPDNMYKGVKSMVGLGPNEKVAKEAYAEGKTLFEQKKYTEAAGKFKIAADRWPDSIMEEDAMFMLGESYFFADQYAKSHDTFGLLLKKYDNTRHLDIVSRREFAMGRYWEQMYNKEKHWPITPNLTDKSQPLFDNFNHAIECYQRVRMYDPTGRLADDAEMATANTYFVQERFEDAAYHYDLLRKEYPTSPFQAQAHVLGLQAKMKVYQGNDYDGTPLKEADEIAQQTLSQFGRELGDERDRVRAAAKQIAEEQASRQWAMGQYYEKKQAYGASRHYYEALVKDHPLTRYADLARARLEAIRDYPSEPPDYFGWLNGILPGEKKGR